MYQSHPWVLGVRKDGSAFGIIADNTWRSKLSLRGRVRFKSEGPAFRVVIIEKDSPQEVLGTLAELSGKMQLPPLWALGYQQCRFSYYPQERVAGLADTLREHRIPCDVIWHREYSSRLPATTQAWRQSIRNLRAEQQAYLIGNDLLVIPRWSESPVLPKDGWNLFGSRAKPCV